MNCTIPQTLSLNGTWEFSCTPETPVGPDAVVPPETFPARMPVPGYWDDHLDSLRDSADWSRAKFNPETRPETYPLGDNPPDGALPFLRGTGWYRTTIALPENWRNASLSLKIGGVRLEAWLLLNQKPAGYHLGHSTPFRFPLRHDLLHDGENEIILAVANTRTDRLGCVIRGWKGRAGGITGPVQLHLAGPVNIDNWYIYPEESRPLLNWQVELAGPLPVEELALTWRIQQLGSNETIHTGTVPVREKQLGWTTPASDLRAWSDRDPALYKMEIELHQGACVLDRQTRPFGLRRLTRSGHELRLNGKPIFLRGATEHAYYPETCTPPLTAGPYRDAIRKLKRIGFNWLRFHTSVPAETYLDAADELGMLIQVEPPKGFELDEWRDILRACRVHPSVVIYCAGNEECLDDEKIDFLETCAAEQRQLAPDALFNPQEALRGVEYYYQLSNLGEDFESEPFPHNRRRLERLKTFSDCFGQYTWGHLSYFCARPDPNEFEPRLPMYERPCLAHEVGIIGNYLDLDLAHRYQGTRIGSGMFDSLRRNLAKAGLLHRAAIYYRNSCAWAALVRKHVIETARSSEWIQGYDFLGGIDCHWHRIGYPCGALNEFYECKPGDSEEKILRYNGENLLFCRHRDARSLGGGDRLRLPIGAALFSAPLENARLSWVFRETKNPGRILKRGDIAIESVPLGRPRDVAEIDIDLPERNDAVALRLDVSLSDATYEVKNNWDFWLFPADSGETFRQAVKQNAIQIRQTLTPDDLHDLENGADLLLLGPGPFSSLPATCQPACAGRSRGNLATVIEDHPLMTPFPHRGYCDWPLLDLLDGTQSVVFDHQESAFDPIIEIVSTFKSIRRQAAIFEYRIGRGRLLVCTLKLTEGGIAGRFLADCLARYLQSDQFHPRITLSVTQLARTFSPATPRITAFTTDQGYDPHAQ